ncbi:MAG: M15 family metallopeptidase [Blastocatellia bacterium]|nr:M15 family metallopeptidase [Blastocatellia bacterium]
MLKISLSPALLLVVLAAPVFASSVRKDEAISLRKGKKGKVEIGLPAENKTVRAKQVQAKEKTIRSQSTKKLNGLHPQAQVKMNAALKDMKAIGVCPAITSGYRSSAEQHDMYRCSHKHHCRLRRGIYSARKPGTSLHEAGLAVDVAAVAYGKKHNRRLTRDGHKIVKVMQKHGFKWRYGLKDPAHFELEPRVAGYKSEKAAITAAQRREIQRRVVEKKAAQTLSKNKNRRRDT